MSGLDSLRLVVVGLGARPVTGVALGQGTRAIGEGRLARLCYRGIEVDNGLLVFAEPLIRLAPLVVSVESGIYLDRFAAILNRLLHSAVLQIDLAARVVGSGQARVEVQSFVEIGERLGPVAGGVLGKPAVQVCIGVIRPDPDRAVEVAHSLIVRSNAQ